MYYVKKKIKYTMAWDAAWDEDLCLQICDDVWEDSLCKIGIKILHSLFSLGINLFRLNR